MFALKHTYWQANPEDASGGTESVPEPAEPTGEGAAAPAPTPEPAPEGKPKGDALWPENWRDEMARGDESVAERLKRFASPADVVKSYRSLEHKLSQAPRDYWKPPKDADEEALKQWRADRDIPDSPDGYEDYLEGVVLGEGDKELADDFFKAAHEANLPPSAVKSALDWFQRHKEEAAQQQQEHDKVVAQETEEALRREWGGEYRSNLNAVMSLLDFGGEDVKERLLSAYTADGTPVMSDPDVLRYMRQLAGELNPAGSLVPSSGLNQLQPVEDRISEIEHVMRADRSRYDRDEKMQQELRTLYTAREKLRARA